MWGPNTWIIHQGADSSSEENGGFQSCHLPHLGLDLCLKWRNIWQPIRFYLEIQRWSQHRYVYWYTTTYKIVLNFFLLTKNLDMCGTPHFVVMVVRRKSSNNIEQMVQQPEMEILFLIIIVVIIIIICQLL